MAIDPQIKNFLTQLAAKNRILESALVKIEKDHDQLLRQLETQPRSISEEIDSIPGRRIFYNFVGSIDFTIAQLRTRGEPINFLVSQDGPFIATHYPWAAWKPNAPTNATNFGQWSPVSSWPLPTQQNTGQDRIDLSYEVIDGGSQRNFQNAAAGAMFSRPDNLIPLPCPTLFAPNTVIQIFPTYENILFDGSVDEETTAGELVIVIPGYKICNL